MARVACLLAIHAACTSSLNVVARPPPAVLLMRGGSGRGDQRVLAADLYLACAKGDDAKVQTLLRSGADPDSVNSGGTTALMAACLPGHEACAQILLQAGADPNKARPDGNTALVAACTMGHEVEAVAGGR